MYCKWSTCILSHLYAYLVLYTAVQVQCGSAFVLYSGHKAPFIWLVSKIAAAALLVCVASLMPCTSFFLLHRAGVQPGKTVVILGAGPIGMVTLLCAKAFGADAIAVTDIKESNLQLVESYGATPVQVSLREPPQEISSRLKGALAAASGVDVVIDCAGFQQTLDTAMDVVTPGGKIVLVGMGQEHLKLPAHVLTCKEIDLCGSFRYANTYPLCINLLHSKRVDVHPLITHRFGFNAKDVAAGFDTAARADVTNAIKVMFNLD